MTTASLAATAATVLFPLAMLYAGLMDLMTMKIRNALVLAIAAAWLVLAPLAGFTLTELGSSLGVAALVFVAAFICFSLGWIGGGDAKLAAASALWFQPSEALIYFIYASILGGLLTVLILQFRTQPLPARLFSLNWVANLHDGKAGVPYGAAMAPAALIVFPQTDWIAHAIG